MQMVELAQAVRAARSGDKDAVEALYRHYRKRLWFFVCRNIDSHIKKINNRLRGEDKEPLTELEEKAIRDQARDNCLAHLVLVVDEFTELKRFSSESNDVDFCRVERNHIRSTVNTPHQGCCSSLPVDVVGIKHHKLCGIRL